MIHWIWLIPAVVTGFAVGFILCNELIAKPLHDAAYRYRLMMERHLRSVMLAQETAKPRRSSLYSTKLARPARRLDGE